MSRQTELIAGTCQHFLFSPRGDIEGVLLSVARKTVQVSMPPEIGAVMPLHTGVGKRLRLFAVRDDSPKTLDGVHAVYAFEALADRAGEPIDPADMAVTASIKGIVARIHHARHGQPNGVVLESGEFIHLRPHGMAALDLVAGAKISARGELRLTILGTRMLEAHHANGYDIE